MAALTVVEGGKLSPVRKGARPRDQIDGLVAELLQSSVDQDLAQRAAHCIRQLKTGRDEAATALGQAASALHDALQCLAQVQKRLAFLTR